jgi:MFS family permease
MWAKDLTDSNAVAGSVFVALGLPTLLAPLAGLVIDRFRRRQVMIAVDLVTAVALLGLLFVHDRGDLWIIYAVAAIYGASLVTFQSARSALLHTMLQEHELGHANGSLSTIREALRLIGPAAGAGLYAWRGGQTTALLDAATFLISAAALLAMRISEPKPVRTHGEPLTAQLSSGLAHIRRTPILRAAVVCVVTAMLALGLSESVYFAVIDQGLHKPVTFLGILQSAMGVGAIIGGVLITMLIHRTGERRPIAAGLALVALGAAASLVPSALVVALGMVCLGAGLPITVVCITTLLQRNTPPAIQGRVFTTFEMLTGVPQVASIAAGAALVGFVDFHILLGVMAGGLGAAAIYAFVRLRETTVPLQLADLAVLDDQPAIGGYALQQPSVVADEQ